MKIFLFLIVSIGYQFQLFGQRVVIKNMSMRQVNYVYKDCFQNDFSHLIDPYESAVINIDSSMTTPLQVFFPNAGHLFNSVLCLPDDTLKISYSISGEKNEMMINCSNTGETKLFYHLNNQEVFFSRIMSFYSGYNYDKPNVDKYFKRCRNVELQASSFLDSINKLSSIRPKIKELISYQVRLNIFEAYLAPIFEWGNNVKFTTIPKSYQDTVRKRALILENVPTNFVQYMQLPAFNYARFLAYIEGGPMTQDKIFNVAKDQLRSDSREQACFFTLKFGKEYLDPALVSSLNSFIRNKNYVEYFNKVLQKRKRIEGLNLMLFRNDTLKSSNSNIFLTIPEMLGINSAKFYYVDFWATWCRPCLEEIPKSLQLAEEYEKKGFKFIYLSLDEDFEKFQNKISQIGLPQKTTFILSESFEANISKQIILSSVPRYLIVNQNGKIINSDAPNPSNSKLREIFDDLLLKTK